MLLLLLSLMFLFFYFFLYFFLCSVCMYVVCRKRKGYIFYFMTWRISISIWNDGVDIIRSGTWDYSATRMPKEWEDYDCWRSMNCGCCLIRTMWINLISWVPWKWKVIDTDHRHGMGMDCASVWCVWEIERESEARARCDQEDAEGEHFFPYSTFNMNISVDRECEFSESRYHSSFLFTRSHGWISFQE